MARAYMGGRPYREEVPYGSVSSTATTSGAAAGAPSIPSVPSAPTITAPPAMSSSQAVNPGLQAQLDAINREREAYKAGSGHAITYAEQAVRDAGEGERRALTTSGALRGAPAHVGQAAFSANLQRQMAQTGMNAALGREAQVQNMLGLGTQAAGAVASNQLGAQQNALNQYNSQLGAWQYANTANYNNWQAQNQMALEQQRMALQAQQQAFQQQAALAAMRQAQYSSPVYGV